MHDFLASLAPEPFRVLGAQLRPLSFGHVVLLNRFGLESVGDERELVLAVSICQRSFKDGLALATDFFSLGGSKDIEALMIKSQAMNPERAMIAWDDYIEAHSSHPEYCQTDNPESDRGAPFLAQLRGWLLSHCGYTPEYLMDAPFGQCLWDYGATIEEANGWGIVGDKHRAVAELLKEGRN